MVSLKFLFVSIFIFAVFLIGFIFVSAYDTPFDECNNLVERDLIIGKDFGYSSIKPDRTHVKFWYKPNFPTSEVVLRDMTAVYNYFESEEDGVYYFIVPMNLRFNFADSLNSKNLDLEQRSCEYFYINKWNAFKWLWRNE